MDCGGGAGSTSPSTTGSKGMMFDDDLAPPCRVRALKWTRPSAFWAASTRSDGTSRQAAAVPGTPSSAATKSVTRLAVDDESVWCAAPLCSTARRNSPAARGIASSAPMLIAPADSPATVTVSGSPPKAATLSRTHSNAATWSSRPRLGGASGSSAKPSAPSR